MLETECSNNLTGNDNYYIKTFKINSLPPFLFINTNINDYGELINYKDFINKILGKSVKLYGIQYILVSIISMPGPAHYNVVFKNYSNLFGLNNEKWYFYDDMGDSILNELLYEDICINNIRNNNGLALFIYKRMIFN